ncbi:MAG: GNAT family N-acetyltransferase [Patescibacteria group bacterium]|nr:GNAT family N-acetyltransferase [Patescibacteria group bacterium]
MEFVIAKLTEADIAETSTLLLEMWLLHAERSRLVSSDKLKSLNIGDYLTETINDNDQIFLVAKNGNEVVATIRAEIQKTEDFYQENNQLYIDDLFVQKEFRRTGIAKSLINECQRFGKERGVKLMTCKLYEFNGESKELFKSLGFTPDFSFYSKLESE